MASNTTDVLFDSVLGLIADGCGTTTDKLSSSFKSRDDLALYSTIDVSTRQLILGELSLGVTGMIRLEAVSKYLERGGILRAGLAMNDIKQFNKRVLPGDSAPSASSPAVSKSSASSDASDSSASSVSSTNSIKPMPVEPIEASDSNGSRQVNGGSSWQRISGGAIDNVNIDVDKNNRRYHDNVQKNIVAAAERDLGASLSVSRSPASHRGGTEIRLECRCKAYWNPTRGKGNGDEPKPKKSKREVSHTDDCNDDAADNKPAKCNFQVKITTRVSDGSTVIEYKGSHTCNQDYDYSAKRDGLTVSQKEYVGRNLEKGKKPTEIHRKIVKMSEKKRKEKGLIGNNGDFPSVIQIQTYQKNNPSRLASKNISVDEFKKLLEKHHARPEDPDEPFVLIYHAESNENFDYVLTTLRLMEKFKLTDRRNFDMTYRQSTSNFPIYVAGVDDAKRRHHRTMVGVSSGQTWNNFAFASEGQLNHEAASSGGTCRNITLLADSAGAIRNGVTAAAKGKSATNSSPMTMIDSLTKEDGVLNRVARQMESEDDWIKVFVATCYFHMKQAFEANKDKIVTGSNRAEINDDLETLHNIPHPYEAAFDTALSLFSEKWREKGESVFVDYFILHWGTEARRWARCHHPPGYASCNNGQESHNRWMHESGLYKRRTSVDLFHFLCAEMRVASERARQEGGIAEPKDRDPIGEKEWQHYREYVRKREATYGLLAKKSDDQSKTYYPSEASVQRWTKKAKEALKDLQEYQAASHTVQLQMLRASVTVYRDAAFKKFIEFEAALPCGTKAAFAALSAPVTSFDGFKKRMESFYAVSLLEMSDRRKDMCHCCTCPKYQKEAICKHSVKEGVESNMIVDPEAKRMEKRQKRGRSSKTKDCLTRQPGEYMDDSSDDEVQVDATTHNNK